MFGHTSPLPDRAGKSKDVEIVGAEIQLKNSVLLRNLQLPKPYHVTKSERYETSCVSKRQK